MINLKSVRKLICPVYAIFCEATENDTDGKDLAENTRIWSSMKELWSIADTQGEGEPLLIKLFAKHICQGICSAFIEYKTVKRESEEKTDWNKAYHEVSGQNRT